jgi:hypothetical protein
MGVKPHSQETLLGEAPERSSEIDDLHHRHARKRTRGGPSRLRPKRIRALGSHHNTKTFPEPSGRAHERTYVARIAEAVEHEEPSRPEDVVESAARPLKQAEYTLRGRGVKDAPRLARCDNDDFRGMSCQIANRSDAVAAYDEDAQRRSAVHSLTEIALALE